jgi:hypothetical protein
MEMSSAYRRAPCPILHRNTFLGLIFVFKRAWCTPLPLELRRTRICRAMHRPSQRKSHTMHALQPCDVACFGPLASAWKSEVNSASADYVEITKWNLLVFYGKARERALKKTTIISAFAKTGIWPLNHHILEPSVFEPSKDTTIESLQPLPARLPTILVPIRIPYGDADPNVPTAENEARYIIPLPPVLPHTATRQDLRHENQMLRDTLRLAKVQLEKDFTQMKLMDSENGRLRKRAYAKEKTRDGPGPCSSNDWYRES